MCVFCLSSYILILTKLYDQHKCTNAFVKVTLMFGNSMYKVQMVSTLSYFCSIYRCCQKCHLERRKVLVQMTNP